MNRNCNVECFSCSCECKGYSHKHKCKDCLICKTQYSKHKNLLDRT